MQSFIAFIVAIPLFGLAFVAAGFVAIWTAAFVRRAISAAMRDAFGNVAKPDLSGAQLRAVEERLRAAEEALGLRAREGEPAGIEAAGDAESLQRRLREALKRLEIVEAELASPERGLRRAFQDLEGR